MSLHPQQSGFTLLETLVALVIVVGTLGAGAAINQTVLKAAQNSEDQAQALALAEDGVGLARAAIRTGAILGYTNAVPYIDQTASNGKANDVVRWCNADAGTSDSSACPNAADSIGACVTGYAQAECDKSPIGAQKRVTSAGELIPLKRTTITYASGLKYWMGTILTGGIFTTPSVNATTTKLDPDIDTNPNDWDYYRRQINTSTKVVTVSNLISGVKVTLPY